MVHKNNLTIDIEKVAPYQSLLSSNAPVSAEVQQT
jgi:hypothetical protein